MRNLKELFANNESVWLLCETEALQKQFLSQAEEEGFLAINGEDSHFRVNYGKYIAGEDDYICHTPHFSPVIR